MKVLSIFDSARRPQITRLSWLPQTAPVPFLHTHPRLRYFFSSIPSLTFSPQSRGSPPFVFYSSLAWLLQSFFLVPNFPNQPFRPIHLCSVRLNLFFLPQTDPPSNRILSNTDFPSLLIYRCLTGCFSLRFSRMTNFSKFVNPPLPTPPCPILVIAQAVFFFSDDDPNLVCIVNFFSLSILSPFFLAFPLVPFALSFPTGDLQLAILHLFQFNVCSLGSLFVLTIFCSSVFRTPIRPPHRLYTSNYVSGFLPLNRPLFALFRFSTPLSPPNHKTLAFLAQPLPLLSPFLQLLFSFFDFF